MLVIVLLLPGLHFVLGIAALLEGKPDGQNNRNRDHNACDGPTRQPDLGGGYPGGGRGDGGRTGRVIRRT